MKITARTYLFVAPLLFALAGGCRKPGPIELTVDQPALQFIAPTSSTYLLSTADIDTLGYFPQIEETATSHLLLAASEFDAFNSHHEAILARALFLNPSARIILAQDTVYRSLEAGTLALDLLVLRKIDKKYRNPVTTRDTVVGSQYALYAVDGIGGGGISYDSGRVYEWTGSGSASTPRFTGSMTAPTKIHLTSPDERRLYPVSTNLSLRWTGGGDTVRLVVRDWDGVKPGKTEFQIQLVNTNETSISRQVLGILPVNQGKFLFTLYSSSTAWVQPTGFSAPMLVQTITAHNLVVQVKP